MKQKLVLAVALLCCAFWPAQSVDSSYSKAGVETLVVMAVSIGLSIVAGLLLKPKNKSPIQDDKPTTLTSRGAFINYFIGVRRVGPVFAWAGDRRKRKERTGGGKGVGSAPKQDVWYEAGWHLLGVGTCHALHEIIEGGKVLFKGPITNISHPSGSTIVLDDQESFTIYWGEVDQPVNSFLANASRVGISSRWPNCCYVVWNRKRLGSSPQWGIIDYVMERRPSGAFLANSEPWYEPTPTLDGPTKDVVGSLSSADPDVGYIEVSGNFTQHMDAGRPVRITGAGIATGDYTVRRATANVIPDGASTPLWQKTVTRTRIFLEEGTLGATTTGTVQAYTFDTDDGANIAHAVADMIFADFPQGLELPSAGLEPWGMDSLEAWGEEAETEGWLGSLVAVDGERADAVLANALQDHGVMLPLDTLSGELLFQRVREPSGTLKSISDDMLAESLPEIDTFLGDKPVDNLIFSFSDRDMAFSDQTIEVDEDGQVSYVSYHRPRTVGISSTVHFGTAGSLSELRSQEELAGKDHFKLLANRDARMILPGEAIIASQFEEVLRVFDVRADAESDTVELDVMPDFYGARKSDFVNSPGNGGPVLLDVEEDQFKFIEVPEQLLGTEQMFVAVPRIRAHDQIIESLIHFSADNSTFSQVGVETAVAAGGTLDSSMSADGPNFSDQGPTITIYGPDISNVQDLSADPVNFGLGRQVCVIASPEGIEICFLEKVTALSATQYRLDGLLRARYDTRKVSHSAGGEVFIFDYDAFTTFQDVLLIPGEELYVKSQPSASGGLLPLSATPSFGRELYGKGLVPIPPEAPYCVAPFKGSPTYRAGDDVTVRWLWSSASSPNTGAGLQNAGTPISDPVLKGAFLVELLTAADALVSSQSVTTDQVTFASATLAASPISNGTFKVRISQTYNGFVSSSVTLTVTNV